MNDYLLQLLFLVIIINPVSQVMLIVGIADEHPERDVSRLIYFGNLWAFLITALIAVSGAFLFRSIFQVDLATLRLVGGLILAGIGYNRISKGVTFQMSKEQSLREVGVVPFAVPMVVGPAAFSHAVTVSAEFGTWIALAVVFAALALNLGLMRLTLLLKRWISRNVVSVSIRLSGLVTMTVGLQMVYESVVQLVKMAR